jgi:hypothetical protein
MMAEADWRVTYHAEDGLFIIGNGIEALQPDEAAERIGALTRQVNQLSELMADKYEEVGRLAALAVRNHEALKATAAQVHGLDHPLNQTAEGEIIDFEHCTLYVCRRNRRLIAELDPAAIPGEEMG